MSQSLQDSARNLLGPLATEYSFIVHCISLVCFGLGLIFLIPITILIILDLFLWLWRMFRAPSTPHSSKPSSPVATEPKPSGLATGLDTPTLRL
ncbi:hypothetical protein B0J13DRAFT_619401 [Dactylonectria estremocensis]|uniref:Uncharacterized protein n=1 Tax=Dactylonectria estremocensis TaxID=1079267 RepID=A0A9P9J5F7_9HYPO|nr:hypothetical protein B0J13DRAFT_619401 [Dactylonectria estremocensis]